MKTQPETLKLSPHKSILEKLLEIRIKAPNKETARRRQHIFLKTLALEPDTPSK